VVEEVEVEVEVVVLAEVEVEVEVRWDDRACCGCSLLVVHGWVGWGRGGGGRGVYGGAAGTCGLVKVRLSKGRGVVVWAVGGS
jgi:hypothetical protein